MGSVDLDCLGSWLVLVEWRGGNRTYVETCLKRSVHGGQEGLLEA